MSAGLEFTIRDQLNRGKDPEDLIEEIKTNWPIKDNPQKIERAKNIIKNITGQEVGQSKFQQALNGGQ